MLRIEETALYEFKSREAFGAFYPESLPALKAILLENLYLYAIWTIDSFRLYRRTLRLF